MYGIQQVGAGCQHRRRRWSRLLASHIAVQLGSHEALDESYRYSGCAAPVGVRLSFWFLAVRSAGADQMGEVLLQPRIEWRTGFVRPSGTGKWNWLRTLNLYFLRWNKNESEEPALTDAALLHALLEDI